MTTFNNIYSAIQHYIRKLTHDKEKIDEITQEVFIKVHQSLHTLNDEKKLLPWLKRIVYTTLIDYYRNQNKYSSSALPELTQPEDEVNEEGFEDVVQCIKGLIEAMPEEERTLLMAIELQGVSQTQYAATFNIPLSTVKSRIQRAREKLRTQISGNCFLLTDPYGNIIDHKKPEKLNAIS